MPPLRAVLTDVVPIERRNMNLWEDEAAKAAVVAAGRRTLVVADACGGLTYDSHWAALQRMQQAGAVLTSWLQVLLEFQRDWTRRDTYEAGRYSQEAGTTKLPIQEPADFDYLERKELLCPTG